MSKIAVVFWSGTGNTEAMADFIVKGAKATGTDVDKMTALEFSPEKVNEYDAIAFGCPSMGAEVLEEDEFEPMWSSVKSALAGKKIALFGSYDWGDGEWMRNWSDECDSEGFVQAAAFVICNNTPDDEGKTACLALGNALAS